MKSPMTKNLYASFKERFFKMVTLVQNIERNQGLGGYVEHYRGDFEEPFYNITETVSRYLLSHNVLKKHAFNLIPSGEEYKSLSDQNLAPVAYPDGNVFGISTDFFIPYILYEVEPDRVTPMRIDLGYVLPPLHLYDAEGGDNNFFYSQQNFVVCSLTQRNGVTHIQMSVDDAHENFIAGIYLGLNAVWNRMKKT